jgi:hypothetical protein
MIWEQKGANQSSMQALTLSVMSSDITASRSFSDVLPVIFRRLRVLMQDSLLTGCDEVESCSLLTVRGTHHRHHQWLYSPCGPWPPHTGRFVIYFRYLIGLLSTSDQPVAKASTYTGQHNI